MADVLAAAVILIALAFGMAGVSKLAHWRTFVEELRGYEFIPGPLILPIATVLPILETLGAVAVLVPDIRQLGIGILATLLLLFTAITARAVFRGLTDIKCACFGKSTQQLGWAIPLRNVVMASVLVASLSGPDTVGSPTVAGIAAAALGGTVLWVLVQAMQLRDSIQRTRA